MLAKAGPLSDISSVFVSVLSPHAASNARDVAPAKSFEVKRVIRNVFIIKSNNHGSFKGARLKLALTAKASLNKA